MLGTTAFSARTEFSVTTADGDPNPEMVLADLDTSARESAPTHSVQAGL